MFNSLSQTLAAMPDKTAALALSNLLNPLFQRMESCMLTTAGLVVKAGASPLAKTGAAITHYIATGIKGRIAASTDMPALTGLNVANARWNAIVFTVNKLGVIRAQIGKQDALSEAGIRWPELDQGSAIIGMLIINPTTGSFTGGTTALDDVNMNIQFISPIGAFDPTIKL